MVAAYPRSHHYSRHQAVESKTLVPKGVRAYILMEFGRLSLWDSFRFAWCVAKTTLSRIRFVLRSGVDTNQHLRSLPDHIRINGIDGFLTHAKDEMAEKSARFDNVRLS